MFDKPWKRTLAFSMMAYSVAILYCHFNFYRDPGSLFYNERYAFDRIYSAYRQQEAERYIIDLATQINRPAAPKSGRNPKVCATMVSVKREGEQYLPVALASALHGLTIQERSDLSLHVLIAHVNLTTHPTTRLHWPSMVADRFSNYDLPAPELDRLDVLERENNFSEKAVIDYRHALRACYDTGAEWVVLFEDDIILADGWFAYLLWSLQQMVLDARHRGADWLFLRLFNQERSTGWASRDIGRNHELLISILLGVPIAIFLSLLRRGTRVGVCFIDRASVAIICVLVVPAFVILFFQAGKASMLPPRSGIRDDEFLGCCSQGLVFPRARIPRVVEYLATRGRGQIDNMLNDLAVEDSLRRYSLYPVQLQHLGTRSSRETDPIEAQAIWSMAFERHDAADLRVKHAKLVDLVYGEEGFY